MAGGTKKRKYQKTKASNIMYKNENRHEKSHVRRIVKHLARYGDTDKKAVEELARFKAAAGMRR